MEMFTWEYLATAAGASTAVTVVTQFLKGFPIIKKIPAQFLSYIVSLSVMLLAGFFTETLTPSSAAIMPLNAIVIMLAANGAYNIITKKSNNFSDTNTES